MTEEKLRHIKELENELSYLIKDSMTTAQKIKCLANAYWEAQNSGYCDAMANKLMGGEEDEQTLMWEKNCQNKYKIGTLHTLLTELTEEGNGKC